MGKGKRVLFLGQTGVAKKDALTRLAAHCRKYCYRDCEVVDFDQDWLIRRVSQNSFLDDDIRSQRRDWEDVWDECFTKRIRPLVEGDKDIFLGLHGCYTRSQYGSRCVLDLQRVAKFNPTLIVTLIADVYDMWWRTERRAGGEAWRGRPTIEHLIGGRRAEVMVADQLALECSERPRSLVIAVGHPCDTIAKCIFSENPKIVYLSFPISEPRRMEADGNFSGIKAVSDLIACAHAKQKTTPDLAFICPLAIDELPFSKAFDPEATEETPEGATEPRLRACRFERDALRWDLSQFWPLDERMGPPAEPYAPFWVKDVKNAAGSILTDVAWRDFRLAEQADRLAVFNPIFPGRDSVTGGVANEVAFAIRFGHPVYVYQDAAFDPKGLCGQWIKSYGSGTMGQGPSGQLINLKHSIDELLDSL